MANFCKDIEDELAYRREYERPRPYQSVKGAMFASRYMLGYVPYGTMNQFLKSRESSDCFESFKRSVRDAHSSLVQSICIQNEVNLMVDGTDEQFELARNYLHVLLYACGTIKDETDVDETIRRGVLDSPHFHALRILHCHPSDLLSPKISYSKVPKTKQSIYAGRKGFAKRTCSTCSGGEQEDNADICLENAHNCYLEENYKLFVKEVYTDKQAKWEKKYTDDFMEYWFLKAASDRRVAEAEALQRNSIAVPEAVLVQQEQIPEWLSQLSSQAKALKEKCKDIIRRPMPGRKIPIPARPSLGGILMSGVALIAFAGAGGAGYSKK